MMWMVLVIALAGVLLATMLYTASRPRIDVSLRDAEDPRPEPGRMRW
jgi:uncharacterized membrane protein affecting hemolysin expression